jgi:redox-sensing transcriptional repressor
MSPPETLSEQSIGRLCRIYGYLCRTNKTRVTSSVLGAELGIAAHNVRKDLSLLLGKTDAAGAAYDVERLRKRIGQLGFEGARKSCVVGLGALGQAILADRNLAAAGCVIAAGFDTNVNLLETIRSPVRLYPSHEAAEVVRREGIEVAFLTAEQPAQEMAGRLEQGGIRAILNFTPAALRCSGGIVVRDVDLAGEFRMVSAILNIRRAP